MNSEQKKQKSKKQKGILSCQGWTRTVNGSTDTEVEPIDNKPHKCEICKAGFGNKGALSSHMVWQHATRKRKIEDQEIPKDSAESISLARQRDIEEQGSSKDVGIVEDRAAVEDREVVLESTVEQPEKIVVERKSKKKEREKKTPVNPEWRKKPRVQYNACFKAKILAEAKDKGVKKVCQTYSNFGLTKQKVSNWQRNEMKIKRASMNEYSHSKKIRPSTKYSELNKELLTQFENARNQGVAVDFNWLWVKANTIYAEQKRNRADNDGGEEPVEGGKEPVEGGKEPVEGEEEQVEGEEEQVERGEEPVEGEEEQVEGGEEQVEGGVKKHVIVNFIKKNKIKMRRVERNKKMPKEAYRVPMQLWHLELRQRLIRTGEDSFYDPKWGHFLPRQRFNVDQSPMPFSCSRDRTYEKVESGKKVWVSSPIPGADKRFCSLNICFRPEGEQPRLAIIFRGKGKRISKEEKAAWDEDVDVYFQKKAWADSKFCTDWARRTLAPVVNQEDHFVLFADNLTGQRTDEFKETISDMNGLNWYGPKNATDIWQPVDGGYARTLKVLIQQAFFRWLSDDANAQLWYGPETAFTQSQKRVLITKWSGAAARKLNGPAYDSLRWRMFEKTGCLMTASGEGDAKINPEGLPDYSLLTVPMGRPTRHPPVSNAVPFEDEEEEESCEILWDDFEGHEDLLCYTEKEQIEEDGNIFDIFDKF